MKVILGTDHAGFALKEVIKKYLTDQGYEVNDCGAYTFDPEDDYPDFISKAGERVAQNSGSLGIVFGGSGQGEAITANKVNGVRCALFYGPVMPSQAIDAKGTKSTDPFEMLKLTREHNNSNILSLGVRFLSEDDAIKAVKLFLESKYLNEPRHARRIQKIADLEQK